MEIRYPNYYRKFKCIAGDCPDTCCAGWEIPVDRASEKRYKEAQKSLKKKTPDLAKKLRKHIKNGRIISEDVTCPFLNQDGLCEMYMELGPDSLCNTCKRHPRHMEDYGNLHEVILLLSCPEAARLVLEENDGGFYVRNLSERRGNLDGIQEELLECLLQVRERIWKWNADTSMSVDDCMMCAMALAHDVQRRLQREDYEGIRGVLERYEVADLAGRFKTQWKARSKGVSGHGKEDSDGMDAERFVLMADFMGELADLETISPDWPKMLETCRTKLYHSDDSRETYAVRRLRILNDRPEIKSDARKIFEYFIYSFLLSALYDGDLLTKVKMAVLCTMAVEELYLAEECLNPDTRIHICHAIARQIENCDENRMELEKILKQECFCARRIVDILQF